MLVLEEPKIPIRVNLDRLRSREQKEVSNQSMITPQAEIEKIQKLKPNPNK
jgi:hypothetical protein